MISPNVRSANATIAGYVYQFDLTILELMKAQDDAIVKAEGIEDLDIQSGAIREAVQCKYLTSGNYTPKSLRDAIFPMLEAHANGLNWRFRLYAHFGGNATVPSHLSLEELKTSLTKYEGKPNEERLFDPFTDEQMTAFLDDFSIETGPTIEDQQGTIFSELRSHLGGTLADAAEFHYPNALALVASLSTKRTEAERTISRRDFIRALDNRSTVFTRWHEELVGREAFKRALRRRIKEVGLLKPTKRRLMALSATSQSGSYLDPADLIRELATSHFGRGKLGSAKPWTVVLVGSRQEAVGIKERLLTTGVYFNDGYEEINFSLDAFEQDPVINTKGTSKRIDKVSYSVRLIRSDTWKGCLSELTSPSLVINCGGNGFQLPPECDVPCIDLIDWNAEEIWSLIKGEG